jgi:hypothetical protein
MNTSIHKIKIMPYYKGNIYLEGVKNIPENSSSEVLFSRNRGKSAGLSYATDLMFSDSLFVLYDDSICAVHYPQNLTGDNPQAIKYDNTRNLFNEKNYQYKIISEEKYKIHTEYTFTFTEQDYLDAKEK